jgi:hypothetical protein
MGTIFGSAGGEVISEEVSMNSTVKVFFLGVGTGAILLALTTRTIPKMSARVMQEMMSRMEEKGGLPEM